MKVSLVGFGHLGKWHAQKLEMLYGTDFHSIVEVDNSKHEIIKQDYKKQIIVESLSEIIDQIDAVVIATPTTYHHQIILEVLQNNKHCFVEKPMTSTFSESLEICEILGQKNLVFQVGHSERFHPFWPEIMKSENFDKCKIARFDRLAPYKGRGDDVDIIYDLMIHDYDLLTMLGFKGIQSIEAWGDSCHTKKIDFCTSKIKYSNGVVFVTASRSNFTEKRAAEFLFDDGILEIDLMNESVKRSYSFKDNVEKKFERNDHLLEEHKLFKKSIEEGKNNSIGIEVGHLAMKMMDLTIKSIKEKKEIFWS